MLKVSEYLNFSPVSKMTLTVLWIFGFLLGIWTPLKIRPFDQGTFITICIPAGLAQYLDVDYAPNLKKLKKYRKLKLYKLYNGRYNILPVHI